MSPRLALLACFLLPLGLTAKSAAQPADAPAPAAAAAEPDPLRVMTFNIRYANPGDGADFWPRRRHLVTGLIRWHRPAVLGVQEALWEQALDLMRALPDYESLGEPRDGMAGGERCTIFYDARVLRRVRSATFWLSPTPEVPSAAWGAKLRRICTWVELELVASGRRLFVFNTHFDHQSEEARLHSALLLAEKVREIAGESATVVMGDLNCEEDSPPLRVLTRGEGAAGGAPDASRAFRDARRVASEPPCGPSGTFTGFGHPELAGRRIDFILLKGAVAAVRHLVLSDSWNGRTPSDHRPVAADLLVGADPTPTTLHLSHGWRLGLDPEERGTAAGWGAEGFDDSAWPQVDAGAPWELAGHEYDGVAWLRQRVWIPAAWSDRTVRLLIEAVDDSCSVQVGGTEVAPATPTVAAGQRLELELPAASLKLGADNLIALRVMDSGGWGGLVGLPVALVADP